MRGIAFRFSDLRSLFYHAKMSMHEMGKTSAVRVPKQVGSHGYKVESDQMLLSQRLKGLAQVKY